MEQMSPMLQARIEQQQAYQTQNSTNTFVSSPRADIGEAKLEQLDKDTFDYSVDDGKISFGDKLKNFGKGLISPITAMFSSPKNFLIGAGIIAAGAALTIATGGAIAPLFVALGVTGGAIQLGTSIYKASKATTDDEAEAAWQGIGAGTSAVGMSILGSKAALKGAGVDAKGMGFLRATVECFKQIPRSISNSAVSFMSKVYNVGTIKASNPDYNVTSKEINSAMDAYQGSYTDSSKSSPDWTTFDKMFNNERIADSSKGNKVVYRGVRLIKDTHPLVQEGNKVPCKKFVSTSESKRVAMWHAENKVGAQSTTVAPSWSGAKETQSNYLMEIELPENTRFLTFNKINKMYRTISACLKEKKIDLFAPYGNEQEVLLARNGFLEVLSVDKQGGIIKLRYIQQ